MDKVFDLTMGGALYCLRLTEFWQRYSSMELSGLLGERFGCDCGREHCVPVRQFLYESGALERIPEVIHGLPEIGAIEGVALIADARTWDVCGEKVCEVLRQAALPVTPILVADQAHGGPVCDDSTARDVRDRIRAAGVNVVVTVGSGVINDLCKWSSFELGLPYLVVATAASMNGYAAANVAAKIDGVKVLVEARPPVAVLAEPDIIADAPSEMTTAGFGDTIAKYQSNTDWLLNHRLLEEYYCDFCAGIVAGLESLYLDRPEDIAEKKPRAVGGLFEALFWSGIAMTVVGTSAPASGGEHLLSHTLDMVSDVRDRPHDLHGRQVGIGTIVSAALYDRILALESPALKDMPHDIEACYWASPPLIEAVRAQYAAKQVSVDVVTQRLAEKGVWDELRAALATVSRRPDTIRNWLLRAGGAVGPADIGCDRSDLKAAMLHMHEMRRRFTVVDLAWMAGVLPGAADDIIDQWLTT